MIQIIGLFTLFSYRRSHELFCVYILLQHYKCIYHAMAYFSCKPKFFHRIMSIQSLPFCNTLNSKYSIKTFALKVLLVFYEYCHLKLHIIDIILSFHNYIDETIQRNFAVSQNIKIKMLFRI